MEGATAVLYSWTLNGKGAVTTSTYTVPADAKSGDAIKVVVTDLNGNTASDTVYVGGFTILEVEPTTAQDNQGTGYKYIRAYFSNSLKSLAPEDIVLRDKMTEQLFSIDTVKLSSDGTYADITLFGDNSEGGTTFLQGGDIYVITITSEEVSDSYEFELPVFYSNVLVTSVDIEKDLIHLEATLTSSVNAAGLDENFEVGDVYEDNLGTLVGHIVNVGVNSDNELEKISVRDADVVYGVMKFTNGDNNDGTASTKDYFQDVVTKDKYYWTDSATSRINPTQAIKVVNGDDIPLGIVDTTYNYAKLVLNPNGTVACAVLDGTAWTDSIRVAEVNDTIVTETSKANMDFDGYTIEKYGEYVTPEDLEDDDIIFYDSTAAVKFAEVYNVVVDGEPSDITATSIAIDGVSYKWYDVDSSINTDAKYYDADNDAYVEFNGANATNNVAAQKILANYDETIGVTAYLDRLGNIAYIDGTDKDDAVTTDTWYVTTSKGSGYTQALAGYLKFKVSDGKEQTIEIPVSQLKKFNGVDIKKVEFATGGQDDGSDYEFTFTAKKTTTNEAFGTAIQAQNLIEKGVLVKITRDADGKIIGVSFPDGYKKAAADNYDWIDSIDGGDKALEPGVSKVTTAAGTKAKLTDDTIIWVYTTDDDGDITVSKETFEDYTRTTNKVSELIAGGIGPFVLVDGSSVTDILLRETLDADDKSDTFAAGDTNDTEGIVLSITQKKNSDGNANYNSAVKILEIDGSEVTYEALDETALATANKDVYISLKLDKATGQASKVTENAWDDDTYVDLPNSSSKELKTLDGETVKIDAANQVLKKTATGYEAITMKQIVASTKQLSVKWHDQYYNIDDDVHYADFLVVEEATTAAAATEAELTAKTAVELANTTYTALLAGTATMAEYEAADAAADGWIATWADLAGVTTVTDAALGFSAGEYATFTGYATAYAAAKANIDAVAETTNMVLDVALTAGKAITDWGAAITAAWTAGDTEEAAVAGYTPAYAMATGETLVSTVNADTNKIDVTVSDDGYTKTWTLTVTDMSDLAAAQAELNSITAADLTVTGVTYTKETTGDADTKLAADKTSAESAIKTKVLATTAVTGLTACTNTNATVTITTFTAAEDDSDKTYTATVTLTCDEGATVTIEGVSVTTGALT